MTAQVTPRTPPQDAAQRDRARLRANEVRFVRSRFKADLRAGVIFLDEWLDTWQPDPRLLTMPLMDLLTATPGIQKVRARDLLGSLESRRNGVLTVADLTRRDRQLLALKLYARRHPVPEAL